MNKILCDNFKRCECGRCKLPQWKTSEDNCCVCKLDNTVHPPCKKASQFVRDGLLYEFDRHG